MDISSTYSWGILTQVCWTASLQVVQLKSRRVMSPTLLLLAALFAASGVAARKGGGSKYGKVEPINRSLHDDYCDQPLFITFLPRTEENQLLDNICYTFFPLPDNPNTYQVYASRVFCDGSSDVMSYIATDIETGVVRFANPYCTSSDIFFGYVGCDTYLVYRSHDYGSCGEECDPDIFGLSPSCRTIGLSCLRKVDEVVHDNCLPEIDYYVLPMKLPNRCVTQQNCLNPSTANRFYKTLGFAGPLLK